jgi:hypothetical protein
MANLGQALDPNAGSNPPPQAAPQPGPDDTGGAPVNDLAGQWSDWIGKPANRAALAQFGIAMLQPVRQGETGTSHFANAVGYGGEAANTVNSEALKEKQVNDTSELKAAQANLAQEKATAVPQLAAAQAQTAEARTEAAGERAQANVLRTQQVGEQTKTLRDIQKANAYQNYVRDTTKTNSDPLNPTPTPVMDRATWEQSQGLSPSPQVPGGAPLQPGPGVKPKLNDVITKNPTAWNQIKTLAASGDPRGLKALDAVRNSVSDPQMIDELMKQ